MDSLERVIDASIKKRLIILLAAGVALAGCAFLVWLVYPDRAVDRLNPRDAVKLYIGCFLTIITLVCFAIALLNLFRRESLRVGREGIELLSRREDVVGKLPYANIDKLELLKLNGTPVIGIALIDASRPDTFWPGGWFARAVNRFTPGYDVTLSPEWSAPLEEVFQFMDEAYRRVTADS